MARYFRTSNASRRYSAGGHAFIFEPVENIGGSWTGLLAVEDDSAASSLAAANLPQVTEITADAFEGLKKKPLSPNSSYRESAPQRQAQSPQLALVGAAVVATSPIANNPAVADAPAAVSIDLVEAAIEVPDELKTEAVPQKKRRK
jgi:hypothetical protein